MGIEDEMTKGCRGWVGLSEILDNVLSIFTLYICKKCINIKIKQMFKLYISVLGVYVLATA